MITISTMKLVTARLQNIHRACKLTQIRYSTSTINEENLKVFSEKMNEWWELNGPVKSLHALNKLRVPFIIDGLKKAQKDVRVEDMKILDIGCGGGILSEALAKEGAIVTGLDASDELISIASQHSNLTTFKTKPTFVYGTIEEHAQEYKDYYDGVVASEVIEHVNNKELFVKSCVETLKPGGKIFLTAPNKTRLSQFYVIWFGENVMNSPPKGTHQYEMFISDEDLTKMLQKYNCETNFTTGIILNILTTKWYWSSNKKLFFALQATKSA